MCSGTANHNNSVCNPGKYHKHSGHCHHYKLNVTNLCILCTSPTSHQGQYWSRSHYRLKHAHQTWLSFCSAWQNWPSRFTTNFCNSDSFEIFSADNVKITELSFRDDGVLFLTFRPALRWEWIITRACHDTWCHPNFFWWHTWWHAFYAARIKDTGYVDTLCNNMPQMCLGILIDDFIENHTGITLSVVSTSNCMENTSMKD